MTWLSHVRVLPPLALAGFVIVSSAQTSCSSSGNTAIVDAGGGDASASCPAGQVVDHVGGQSVCCVASGASLTCAPTGPEPGQPCSPVGATSPYTSFTIRTDTCVVESCDGNRTSTTYDASTGETRGTLTCAAAGWQKTGPATVQTVVRACQVTGTIACSGSGYGYGYCAYTAYSCPVQIPKRTIVVVSSTCATGGAAETTCDPGSL
jgi:hypothetical protein